MTSQLVGPQTPELDFEQRVGMLGFNDGDRAWLSQLTEENISVTWMQMANDLALADSRVNPFKKHLDPQEDWVRSYLYEGLLGFSDPESPMYRAYGDFSESQQSLVPIASFARVMRTVHGEGVGVLQASMTYPDVWSSLPAVVRERIVDVKDVMGEDDGLAAIESSARILSYARCAKRLDLFLKAAGTRGWPEESARRLLLDWPLVVVSQSEERMALYAQYFAQFGSGEHTAPQIRELLMVHPDRHLVAIQAGIPRYTRGYIRKATQGMTIEQCRQTAVDIIADPKRSYGLGTAIIDAHQRFHASPKRPARLIA
jgi:hypothetical protein